MIDHFNQQHSDLVELGLKLKKSKAARRADKVKRANKVTIGDSKRDSDSDSDLNDDATNEGGQDKPQTRSKDIFDPYGKGIFKPGADGDIENDSDLEDLMEMEQVLLEKKRKRDERRQLRRAQRQAQRGYTDEQPSDGDQDAEDDLDIVS